MTAAAVREARSRPARAAFGDAGRGGSVPMTGEDFRRWKEARGYTGYMQVVADLCAPLSSLSNVEGRPHDPIPPDLERLCRMNELLDRVASADPARLPYRVDRDMVAAARGALAAWSGRAPGRTEWRGTARDWQCRRRDRMCHLAALVAMIAERCRSPALADARLRAVQMVEEWRRDHA